MIVVAGANYSFVESCLAGIKGIGFHSMKNARLEKIDSQLETMFLVHDKNNRFGVYLMSESQGRGTDLKSKPEIE